jgi:hypothetical protein
MMPEAPPAAPRPPWWRDFDRQATLAAIEEAAGVALSPCDPLPDTLIASAQALGLQPVDLRMCIFDDPHRRDWTVESLTLWARRFHLGSAAGEEGGAA